MKRFVHYAVFALVAVVVFKGCIFSPDTKPPREPVEYLPPTSPENVVNNLQASYERKEIEAYAVLLDPQFIFRFQALDVPPGLDREYWNRDEDSTGTAALFSTNEVNSITLDPGVYESEDALRPDVPGAKRIRLTNVKLEVDQTNGVTLLVEGDIQDMYFRKGSVEAGTDSTKWYLFEWQDQPGASAPRGGVTPLASDPSSGEQRVSWGRILADAAARR